MCRLADIATDILAIGAIALMVPASASAAYSMSRSAQPGRWSHYEYYVNIDAEYEASAIGKVVSLVGGVQHATAIRVGNVPQPLPAPGVSAPSQLSDLRVTQAHGSAQPDPQPYPVPTGGAVAHVATG